MCSKVTCKNCAKATWQGCGMHIEQALAGVAEADRCKVYKTRFGVCTDGAQAAPAAGAKNDGSCNLN